MTEVAEDVLPGTWVLDLRDASARALAEMRAWASRQLTGLGEIHRGDVLLVATELVANAFEHGGGPRHIQLWRSVSPCAVRIEVADLTYRQPMMALPVARDPRGRGLLLVDRLAAAWGVEQDPHRDGKTVWAHVPCYGTGRCRPVRGQRRHPVLIGHD
ncbi:ATP-binding protein [Amycolatopsis sp. NPDC058986]|uniref:ATP-binding protein n=1 Tax=unclassified Amycolatopsis TaxID=2618356 RepID=UPI00367315AF